MESFNAAALTLPRLDRIPARPVIDEGVEGVLEMARALTHASILQAAHLDAHRDLRKAMNSAVEQWLTPFDQQLVVFSGVDYGFTNRLELDTCEDEWLLKKKPAAFVVSCDKPREAYYIDKTATALEKLRPGLGRDLLILLQQASTHGMGMFTPSTGMGNAEYCFWHGESDESHVVENFLDGDELEAFEKLDDDAKKKRIAEMCALNDIPTRAELEAVTPKWATDLPGACYWEGAVPQFPATTSRKLGRILRAANTLADHLRNVRQRYLRGSSRWVNRNEKDPQQPNDRLLFRGTTDLSSPILLRWSYEDPIPRVLDDLYQDVMNAGDLDTYLTGIVCFDPLDAEDCRAARLRFEALLQTTILTDYLIRLSTYPDEE